MNFANFRVACRALGFGLALACAVTVQVAAAAGMDLATALKQLPAASFEDKSAIIAGLAQLHPQGSRELLQAMLDGHVAVRASDKQVFIVSDDPAGYALTDPLTGKSAGSGATDDFDTVGMNNHLRKALRAALAQFELGSPDPAVRKAAIQEMLRSIDDTTVPVLRARLAQEQDSGVRRLINEGLAMTDLDDSLPAARRLAAIKSLTGSLNPDVYNRLVTLADPTGSGTDPAVRSAAAKAITGINSWRSFYGVIENLFFGFSLGSVLVLSAIGLAITFGVMGRHQHGARRTDDAWRLHHVRHAAADAGPSRGLHHHRSSGGIPGFRIGRSADRAWGRAFPVWPAAGNAAGDLRSQSDPAAGGARCIQRQQPAPSRARAGCRVCGRSTGRSRSPITGWSLCCSRWWCSGRC